MISVSRFLFDRLIDVARNPRESLRWQLHKLERARLRRALEPAAHRFLRPVHLPKDGEAHVHTMIGTLTAIDCIWMLTSFYRYVDAPLPLIVHDDGTLRRADAALLNRFFPGCRIIGRAEADQAVLNVLQAMNLQRCARLREQLICALKLFDLQYYSRGRRVLYLDSDILFLNRPSELLAALEAPDSAWVDRYNVDIREWYAWPKSLLDRWLGFPVLPRVNAGLLCVKLAEPDWSTYEEWLSVPEPPQSAWHVEQTLWAIDLSRRGAAALPETYDVHHRYAWEGVDRAEALARRWHGREVISEHYSGTWDYRAMFYDQIRHEFFREPGI